MKKLIRFTTALSILFSLVSVTQAQNDSVTIRAIGWNMQSTFPNRPQESDPEHLAQQIEDKGRVDLWGFSEVAGSIDAETFRAAAEKGSNDGSSYRLVLGTTGARQQQNPQRDDRLAIVFNEDQFEMVGQKMELFSFVGNNLSRRAPLVVHLKGKTTGTQFLFMVNHFSRGNASHRLEQSEMLNEFARNLAPNLPLIAVGDYNLDFNATASEDNPKLTLGDEGMRDPGFDALLKDDHLRWLRPQALVRTEDSRNTVLDFVFIANRPSDWFGVSRILERGGNKPASVSAFSDDGDETDHRPVEAIVTNDPTHPILRSGNGPFIPRTPGTEIPLRILAVLPNPIGSDTKNESVTLGNPTQNPVDLSGWSLIDAGNNSMFLSGTIDASQTLGVRRKWSFSLNQGGDTVRLLDPSGQIVDILEYEATEVRLGQFITAKN